MWQDQETGSTGRMKFIGARFLTIGKEGSRFGQDQSYNEARENGNEDIGVQPYTQKYYKYGAKCA